MKEKDELKAKFSADYKKYYEVELFRKEGFVRKECKNCGRFFWTLVPDRDICPEPPCQPYDFLGNPPTNRRFDYIDSWRQIESFFIKNGHTSVKRYPVVCRWRPDLFFTVASIVDFQRVEGGEIVFDFPYNPLIVPQTCLRFNDIQNVGISGKHYSSFCMIGQHSIRDGKGYWKDKCIDLDYNLLTGPFGISPEEIIFTEDVWLGYGAFGYALEYNVRGLELGNAVFTEFKGSPSNYSIMSDKIIDMGAGLERFTWITQGTPTSYDSVFGPVLKRLLSRCDIEYDQEFYLKYSKLAGMLNLDEIGDLRNAKLQIASKLGMSQEDINAQTSELEVLYALLDHSRTLVFAISDGGLPSNVGGGYNLRVLLRRALGFLDKYKWNVTLEDLCNWHIDYLSRIYPELTEHVDEISKILNVEEERYRSSRKRTGNIVQNILKSSKQLTEDDLIQLYDSEGITPDMLKEEGLSILIPPDFYSLVTQRHMINVEEKAILKFDIQKLSDTRLLFYEDQNMFEFSARIVKIFDHKYVVLDQTAFYPRSGGQENDLGFIGGYEVKDVEKYGGVVLHKMKNNDLNEGQEVMCKVDSHRRGILSRHHTATHLVNGAAQRILGSWVWQNSAYKGIDRARLDITHFAPLSEDELMNIETLANSAVLMNLNVTKEILPRIKAEQKYGFRLYQGGVVPSRELRVMNISGWDVEACGGIHTLKTGDVGLIKIIKSERIQDGVVRLEYVAGEPALKYVQDQHKIIKEISNTLDSPQNKVLKAINILKNDSESLKRKQKQLLKRLASFEISHILKKSREIKGIKVYSSIEKEFGDEYQIILGEYSVTKDPDLVYFGITQNEKNAKMFIFCGENAQQKGLRADNLVKKVGELLGGSGGGTPSFAQGGGSDIKNISTIEKELENIIASSLSG